MKILNARWFTEMGSLRPIGIILGQDEKTGEYKSYIGTGDGNSEEYDAQQILRRGAKFPVEQAKLIV
jgi:hypothetical protein